MTSDFLKMPAKKKAKAKVTKKASLHSVADRKFVISGLCRDYKRLNYGQQMTIADKLLTLYPVKFYEYLSKSIPQEEKPFSLAFFLIEKGSHFLNKEYKKYNFDFKERKEKPKENLDKVEKIGEDRVLEKLRTKYRFLTKTFN